jgi:hypothetical protein
MVKEIEKNEKHFFQCEECQFLFKEKEWAEKCEAWCKEHHTCNLEVMPHAVNEEGKPLIEKKS